jgi:rare lipoprotein A
MKSFALAATLLGLTALSAMPARADGWNDSFSQSREYATFGSEGDRVRTGRANSLRWGKPSRLGAITSDDEAAPAVVRRGRHGRHVPSIVSSGDETPFFRSRRSRSRVASFGSYDGNISGRASYYWQGQRVASGGRFNPDALTAAHKSLPFGTRVRVTHARSGRSVDVTINDRGPFIAGRIIDLSRAAARVIGMTGEGVAAVRLQILGR